MKTQDFLIIASLGINLAMLIFFIIQTRYLGAQTEALKNSIVYSSYQKLNDYINDINLLLLDHNKAVSIFAHMDSMKERLKNHPGLTIEHLALAWHIINRYEAAFTGFKLGVMSHDEWEVWETRMKIDLEIPFLREVWEQDLSGWDYDREFKQKLSDMLHP